jgi:hypothetical protein
MKMHVVSPRAGALCAAAVLALAALVTSTGCADDNQSSGAPSGSTSTTYQGGYSDSGNGIGGLSFTIAPTALSVAAKTLGSSTVEVTGEVRPVNGATVALSGSYDPGSQTVDLAQVAEGATTRARGNTGYSLSGVLSGSAFHGTISTPSGSGGWAATQVSSVSADSFYCGTYNCDTCEGGGGGYFDSITFGSTAIFGVRSYADTSTTVPLAGTRNGSTVTVDDQGITATGTIEGTSIGGTYGVPEQSETGTWNGTSDACGVTLRR